MSYKKDSGGISKGKVVDASKQTRDHNLVAHNDQAHQLNQLQRRARRKAVTQPLAVGLMKVTKSKGMMNAYRMTAYECGQRMLQQDGKITTKYCSYRWCVICSNIRTARTIRGYADEVSTFSNPYFVTLTIPSVGKDTLRPAVRKMIKEFYNCWKSVKRQGYKVRLVRSLEVTWNEERAKQQQPPYHPHLHVLVDGKDVAVALLRAWLKRYKKASHMAQDIRVADKNSLYEIFKYCSKLAVDKKQPDGSRKPVPYPVLDNIFSSLKGLRCFADVGLTKAKVKGDEQELELDVGTKATQLQGQTINYVWRQDVYDWVDEETGLVLADYTPSPRVRKWVASLQDNQGSGAA